METRRRLGVEAHRFSRVRARNPQMLHIGARQSVQLRPPLLRRKIKIPWTHQIAHTTSLMRLLDSLPGVIKFLLQRFRFVREHHSLRQQIEQSMVRARNPCIEFPAGENAHAAGMHRLLDDFFRASDALARQAGMDRAQQLVADGSLGQRQQQRLVHWSGGALGRGIKLANGLDFIAKKLDAQRPVGLGRVHIEDPAS